MIRRVKPSLPLPKYHRVYLVLRQHLEEGQFADGLPGELALTRQFGVARVTVRRALDQLAREGRIARHPGRATRPVDQAASAPVDGIRRTQLTGLLENLVAMGLRTTVRVVEAQTLPAAAAVAQALQVGTGEPVQKTVRVRSTAEGPLSRITTWVPLAVAGPFSAAELEHKPILLLLEGAGVRVGSAQQTISATLADAEVAAELEVPVGSPLLAVRRLIRDEQERPVQWLHGLYRPDRYEYEMQLSRVGGIDAKVWVSQDVAAQFH